jgi:hypothetical protein
MANYNTLNVLSRIKAAVKIAANDNLSLQAFQLGPEGIRLSFEDNATDLLPTMTGMVTSPKPYQACTLTIAILKTTHVATLYQSQFETFTVLGDVVVIPDTDMDSTGPASALDKFTLKNMALENVREMAFNGMEASVFVTMRGYYQVNQGFFGGTTVAATAPFAGTAFAGP